MRHLDQDAGAVPSVRFTAASSPMIEVHQDLETLSDDFMGLAPLHIHDETDTAGVMLVLGIVKTLFGRRPCEGAPDFHLGLVVGHFRERDVITYRAFFEYKFS